MILWFGKKKKLDEAKAAGAAMPAPELSAEELAAQDAAAREKAEIEAKVAEANRAWEERQRREAQDAADEAVRAKAAAELKLLEERREHERLRAEAEAAARAAAEAEANDPGLFGKLGQGLARSTARLTEGLAALGRRKLDAAALEELEDLLITSDMGAKVAARVTKGLAKGRFDREISGEEIRRVLAEEIEAILKPREQVVDFSDGPRPRVVLFVGVNGSGKTTTIGKIASKLQDQGARALLVAGDTFRAAAIEQLTV